jgi:hypothetical protein
MTKMTAVLKGVAVAFAMAIALGVSVAADARVDVLAVDSQVTEANGLATATFKIQVANHEEAAMTSVRAVFAGGIEVALSDVAADATVTSAGQKLTFIAADLPATKNVPVSVTVKYLTNGAEQSLTALLTLRRAE